MSASTTTSAGTTGYDGANDTALRDSFAAFPTNSRLELSRFTRTQFVRKVRALDANLPILGRIARKIAQHSVGRGIFARPLTQDKEWNVLNRKRFEARASNPWLYAVDQSRDLWEDQRLVAETMILDGEYFAALTQRPGARAVQPLDVFEVEGPRATLAGVLRGNPGSRSERWQDGVLTDEYDAPTHYGVRELPLVGSGSVWSPTDVRRVPAEAMIHVFRRRRVKQTRGLSFFFSGVNDGIDVLDLKALEKGTAKLHSMLGLSVRRKKDSAQSNGLSNQIRKVLDTDGNTTRLEEDFWKGAAIAYLGEDEGIDLHSSDRPSPNLLAFCEFLYREIAMTADLPLEVVYDLAKLGGTATRSVNEAAQWVFDMIMDQVVMRHTRRIYIWDTANAITSGELRECRDPEWWACAYRGPAKLNVDAGRTADATVKLLKNGGLTHVRYHEEHAQDAYDEMEEQIQFLAWLKTRATQAGLEYSELIEPTPGSVTNVSVSQTDPNA